MKRQIIIGTAGHIDHGKTALIRALTGRETDRLKEEKQRGISIDLGFTYYDLASGERVGFIDVPGHERFVSNMLTGAFGMDFVLFIIAADEGMMPQSREHLEILKLLQVQAGIVVITKTDLVDEEWRELVADSLDEELSDSFLAKAPRIFVSSKTGGGLDRLRLAIEALAASAPKQEEDGVARLWVDRSFSIKGFGSVVTGTLLGGSLILGQEVMLYPQRLTSKIRRIQIHDESVETAVAGQRVAMNLPAFSKDQVKRGDLVSLPERVALSDRFAGRIQMTKDSPRPLHKGMELRLHLGSRKVPCKVEHVEPEVVKAGQSAWIMLRVEESIPLVLFDRFVLRNLSPVETLCGGQVLEPDPPRGKRARKEMGTWLESIQKGGPAAAALVRLERSMDLVQDRSDLAHAFGWSREETDKWISVLAENGEIVRYSNFLLSRKREAELFVRFTQIVKEFHQKNLLRRGMPKKQGLDLLFPRANQKQQMEVLKAWEVAGFGVSDESNIWLSGFERKLSPKQEALYKELKEKAEAKHEAAKESQWLAERDQAKVIWPILLEEGEIIRLGGDLYASRKFVEEGLRLIVEQFGENPFTVGKFRDAYGISRKQAILLLESYDERKWTMRQGDQRIALKLPKFIGEVCQL
ncbi:selenocysteine-specific translation elongation factor [Gottschalkiaceae bacterium SANA]|nr:selenocysteine-specific translation elongation factor [Gottschalkiaceae bacterium SANA]